MRMQRRPVRSPSPITATGWQPSGVSTPCLPTIPITSSCRTRVCSCWVLSGGCARADWRRVAVAASAPFDANVQYGLIYGLWFLGRVEEADRVASRALEMWPRHYGVWFGRLWLLAGTERYDRALVQIDDVAARPALPPPVIQTLRAAIAAADDETAGRGRRRGGPGDGRRVAQRCCGRQRHDAAQSPGRDRPGIRSGACLLPGAGADHRRREVGDRASR